MKAILIRAAAAAFALSCAASATAQEAEEPRTTWRIMTVDVKPGMDEQYQTMMMETILPAYEAAGLDAPQVHWVMANDDWDYVFIDKMTNGMATFDSHNPPQRVALREALKTSLGTEEKVQEMWRTVSDMEAKSHTYFTHTHP